MSSKRADLVKAYLNALEIRSIVVLAVDGKRPSRLAFEPDKRLRTVETFWFAKAAHAELVMAHARDDLTAIGALRDQGWVDMGGAELRDTVANIAGYLGAPYSQFSTMVADAEKAVDRILANVEKARFEGRLKSVNADYKAYRQRQLAAGQKAISYSEHLAKFTLSLVLLAAKNANAVGLRQADSFAE